MRCANLVKEVTREGSGELGLYSMVKDGLAFWNGLDAVPKGIPVMYQPRSAGVNSISDLWYGHVCLFTSRTHHLRSESSPEREKVTVVDILDGVESGGKRYGKD